MRLQAKLSIPGSDRPLLARPRLLAALQSPARLLFITGPPGSGKTSLAISYVQTLDQPVAWYSMDASDADPAVFLRYLIGSLAAIVPEVEPGLSRVIEEQDDPTVLAATIAETVNTMLPTATLVLDDLHAIERNRQLDQTVGAVLNALLRYCAGLQVVITSRQLVNLDSIITLLARGEARGLNGETLAFTPDEIDRLFTQTLGTSDPIERERLSVACAGWATAVALALTSKTAGSLPPIDNQMMLYAYLANQVLEQLPPELCEFVIDTCVLDYLSTPRCNQVRQRSDSGDHLAELSRRNVFLAPAGSDTFRYHPLFREFLLERLRRQPERLRTLLAAAATLAGQERRWEWAFDVAAQIEVWTVAAEIVAAAGGQLRVEGRYATLFSWLERVPASAYQPALHWLKARLLADRGHLDDALITLDFAARGTATDRMLAHLLRAQIEQMRGHLDAAAELVAPYLDDPTVPEEWQPRILRMEGVRLLRHGDYAAAKRYLLRALDIVRDSGDLIDVARISDDLGVLEDALGAIDQSEQYYRAADAGWQQLGESIHRSITLNNLSIVLLKRGRLQEAAEQLNVALTLAEQYGRPRDIAVIRASLGDVAVAAGDLHTAIQQYDNAYNVLVKNGYVEYGTYSLALKTHCARLQGNRELVSASVDQLRAMSVRTGIDRARAKAAAAGAAWMLGLPDAAQTMQEALDALPKEGSEERPFFLLLHAQILFGQGQTREALQVFTTLSKHIAYVSLPTLACWAAATPDLLRLATARGQGLAAQLLPRLPQSVVVTATAPTLTITTLGSEMIVRGGDLITAGGPITRKVFFCLLAAGSQGISSDRLRECIWGEMGDPTGQALKTAIKRIRRDICDIDLKNGNYVVRLPAYAEYDVEQFQTLVRRPTTPERLHLALKLYKGAYLADVEQPWAVELRTKLSERYTEALVELASYLLQSDPQAALECYRMALNTNPYHTTAVIGAMQAEAALGRRKQALDRFQGYAQSMVNDLGLDPDRAVDQVYRQLLNNA